MGGGKSWWDLGDLDLIFKVTPVLWNAQNRVSMRYIMNQWKDFDQACIDTLLEEWEEFITFWWPWPNFQGKNPIKTVYV